MQHLRELPPSSTDKSGWPWFNKIPRAQNDLLCGKVWPRLSIVTASFNQVQFVEETIRSVLLQGYPNLEYIILDGGSTDGSVEIIKKYEPWLTYWVSEKDGGQADAIYRGFQIATGEYIGWLNSDDVFFPSALKAVARHFVKHPDHDMVLGGCLHIDEGGRTLLSPSGYPLYFPGYDLSFREALLWGMGYNQPAMFWRRDAFFRVEGFDRSLQYCFDYDLVLRLTRRGPFRMLSDMIACFRIHENSKTMRYQERFLKERELLRRRFGAKPHPGRITKLLTTYYCRLEIWKRRLMLLSHKCGMLTIPRSVSEADVPGQF